MTIQDEFEQFHADHPEVYRTLIRLARTMLARGYTRLGIGMLWEVLRYETMLGDPEGAYRLNNNHRSRYARLIMEQEPDLNGFFELRELQSA